LFWLLIALTLARAGDACALWLAIGHTCGYTPPLPGQALPPHAVIAPTAPVTSAQ